MIAAEAFPKLPSNAFVLQMERRKPNVQLQLGRDGCGDGIALGQGTFPI